MQRIPSPAGATVSYETYGSGPPLVLVHGAFSDHQTNWQFVKPLFEQQFTVYAIARRGRGETDATAGHSLEDESRDVVAAVEALDALQATELWPPMIADAEASLGDLRALSRYDFQAERFRELRVPVLLQIGTESPRDLYVTDALAAALPNVRIEELPGQAHEGMTTAPKMYAEAVSRFLLS